MIPADPLHQFWHTPIGVHRFAQADDVNEVLVALADQPLINSQDINDLIGAYKKRPDSTQVVQPMVDGLPGNPVMFSAEVREQILAGTAKLGCRQWQSAHPDQVHAWVSANLRYRTDVDTPEDIQALAERTGHQLKWPCLLYTSPSPRDRTRSRMPSSA